MLRRVVTFLIAGALAAASASAATAATTPTDLFVGGSFCSDTGPGSQTTPFCTIQAAANVVLPGQTVHVANGRYDGPITINRSGEPGEPITFVNTAGIPLILPHGGAGISVAGAHDVVISGIEVIDGAPGVAVSDSARITLEHNLLSGSLPMSTGAGVVVSGQSSDVTVSRNVVLGNSGGGVSVASAATGTTVTTNVVRENGGAGISVDGAPDTVVTANSVFDNCNAGIALTGASTGATVENNILADDDLASGTATCQKTPVQSELTVSADSTTGTTADYDIVFDGPHNLYDWAGTSYSTVADFTAATGQGAHDLNTNPQFATGSSVEGELAATSPAIDSANSDAPGELTIDQTGGPRVDDPLVANTGVGVADRGAGELADPFLFSAVTFSPTKGPIPLVVTISITVTNPWSTDLTYTFDFGDGSAPVVTSTPTATHTYTAVPSGGVAVTSITATTPSGVTKSVVNPPQITITQPAPLVAKLRAAQNGPLTAEADNAASTDSWQITDFATDFGDGTGIQHSTIADARHTYAKPGTYTVTATETDFAGNTATVSQQLTVASGYFPVAPVRVLDTRDGTGGVRVGKLGANGVVSLKLAGTHGIPATGVRAVVLNVTAVTPTADSFLTVYPDGATRPVASNLNYVPGQTVPNLVTVQLGADGNVDFFNHLGTVDVVADLEGYYADSPAAPGTGTFLATGPPTRLLDTRANPATQDKPIGPGGTAVVSVAALGQPAFLISAVVLNVTVTDPTTTSFLTVWPDGAARPTTSNLNFTAGQTTSNLVTVPVTDGNVDVFNHVGSTHVVVDAEGFYETSPDPNGVTTTSFTPLTPTRLLDTRTATGGHDAPLGANGVAALQVRGTAGIPAAATAVVLNVTAVAPTQGTFLTVFPDGTTRPATSDLNVDAGQTVPNLVVAPIGPDGKIDFFNHLGQVDVVADVAGYFAD